MSTFGAGIKLARAVLSKKQKRVIARAMPPKRRRAQGSKGVVLKKFTLIDDRIQCPVNSFTNGADSFELADMPQFSNYIALYEQFRIVKVVYKFKSLAPVNLAPVAGGTLTLGYLHTVVDHNDITPFAASKAGIQSMMNDNAYKGAKSSRDLTRTIRPMFLTQAGTQTAKSTRGWLNCRDVLGNVNAVSHYGIKWVIEGGSSSLSPNPYSCIYEPLITYYVEFKNPQ